MTKDDLYKALIAVKNEDTGEAAYSEAEARKVIDTMDDSYLEYVNKTFDSPTEWADYYTM